MIMSFLNYLLIKFISLRIITFAFSRIESMLLRFLSDLIILIIIYLIKHFILLTFLYPLIPIKANFVIFDNHLALISIL
jgi:hypothetical protein